MHFGLHIQASALSISSPSLVNCFGISPACRQAEVCEEVGIKSKKPAERVFARPCGRMKLTYHSQIHHTGGASANSLLSIMVTMIGTSFDN